MKLTQQTAGNTIVDGFGAFPKGMNAGVAPQILPRDQLSNAINCTIRGDFLTHRPPYRRIALDYAGVFDGRGWFQGAAYYQPDGGPESIVAAIAGRLFQFFPNAAGSALVQDITGPNGPNDPTIQEHWLWQSEKWMNDNDGTSPCRHFDGDNTFNSIDTVLLGTVDKPGSAFQIPDVGGVVPITLAAPFIGQMYQRVNVLDMAGQLLGEFQVVPDATGEARALLNSPNNYTGGPQTIASGSQIQIAKPWYTITTSDVIWKTNLTIPLADYYRGHVGDWIMFVPNNPNNSSTAGTDSSTDGGILGIPGTGNIPGLGSTNTSVGSGKRAQVVAIGTPGLSSTITVHVYGGTGGSVLAAGTAIYPNVNYIKGAYESLPTFTTVCTTLTTIVLPVPPPLPQPPLYGTAFITPPYTGPQQECWINKAPFGIAPFNPAVSGNTLYLLNLTATPDTTTPGSITHGSTIFSLPQLPVGRNGAYVLGRNWIALADGLSYIASDMVGDQSGTPTYQFRDAVLFTTQNALLAGGGAFQVPGGAGDIRFMADLATLDVSLGQGTVQIGTPYKIFSCDAPYLTSIDRANWQTSTNPIVTESLVGRGGIGQRSAVIVNSDLFFRGGDKALYSLVLARREFNTWGNTPASLEVDPVLSLDDPALLRYAAGIFWDNRLLENTGLVSGPQGVYGAKSVALNFDPLSSLRGKSPSVYDGVWQDLNVFQYVKGFFSGVERCFAFCFSADPQRIELWELFASPSTSDLQPTVPADYLDNGTTPITLEAETATLFAQVGGKEVNDLCQLIDGELYVSDLAGLTTFAVYFRPDYDQTWHLWRKWTVQAAPNYQPRMGLGEPPGTFDPATKRPWRDGYSFQFKLVVTGHCVIMGARFAATILPTVTFAPPMFDKPKPPHPPHPPRPVPPVAPFTWSPATASIQWTDKNGTFTGDLSVFRALADIASVSAVQLLPSVTSFVNLSSLPSLASFVAISSRITAIDAHGCANLATISYSGAYGMALVNVTGCSALTTLSVPGGLLTSIIGLSSCVLLNNLNLFHNTLMVASVNAILVQLAGSGITGGGVDLSGQIPAAPPSGAGATAKTALLATVPPWTVTTD